MRICAVVVYRVSLYCEFYREVQVMESQGGSGATEGGGGDGQSGQAASTALIEKILSEEPRWQGKSVLQHFSRCSDRNSPVLNEHEVLYWWEHVV